MDGDGPATFTGSCSLITRSFAARKERPSSSRLDLFRPSQLHLSSGAFLNISRRSAGEQVIDSGSIHIGGKEHAKTTVAIPSVGRVKHYSIIFQGTEFFISSRSSERD